MKKKSKISLICLHMWDFFCNFVRLNACVGARVRV